MPRLSCFLTALTFHWHYVVLNVVSEQSRSILQHIALCICIDAKWVLEHNQHCSDLRLHLVDFIGQTIDPVMERDRIWKVNRLPITCAKYKCSSVHVPPCSRTYIAWSISAELDRWFWASVRAPNMCARLCASVNVSLPSSLTGAPVAGSGELGLAAWLG